MRANQDWLQLGDAERWPLLNYSTQIGVGCAWLSLAQARDAKFGPCVSCQNVLKGIAA